MVHEETVKVFKREHAKHKISGSVLDGGRKDMFWYPDIPDEIKRASCINFNLYVEEEILFVRDCFSRDNQHQGLVITDCSIDYIGDDLGKYKWEKIEKVTFEDNQLNLWGYGGPETIPIQIDSSCFTKGLSDSDVEYYGSILAKMLTNIAKSQPPVDKSDKLKKEISECKYKEEALRLMIKARRETGITVYTPKIAEWYLNNGKEREGLRILDDDIEKLLEKGEDTFDDAFLQDLYLQKYLICKKVGEINEARKVGEYLINDIKKRGLEKYYSNVLDEVNEDFEGLKIIDNKSAAVTGGKLNDVDLELMSTIEECVNKTNEIAEYSKQKMTFIKDSTTKAAKEIEKCILEIQKQQINDPENTQPLIFELKKRKEGLFEMSHKVEHDLKEKVKSAGEFNITLFGPTMVGKSTLMEILTNGDGRTIGKGAQRTTTDIRKYKWRGLTITDVPGINAFQGQEDEEKAFAAAKTADIVLFLISDGQPEATEADWLVKLKKLDKPIICLCNVKASLNSDMNVEMFLDRPNEILDDVSIKEIIAQFNEFVQSKLPKEHIDIFVTQLQARYLANKIPDERKRVALINASRFAEVEKKIIETVKRNGVSFRQKCFLSIIDAPLYEQCLLMFHLSMVTYSYYSIVNDKETEFCNWKDEFLVDEKTLLERKVNNIFDKAISSIPSFVQDNSERDNFNELLRRHIEKLHIDEQIYDAFKKCEDKVIKKVQQLVGDLYSDMRMVSNLDRHFSGNSRIHSDRVNITNQKRILNWLSAISGALSLIPGAGLGFAALSSVLGYAAGKSVSREEKLKKANEEIIWDINKQLNENRGKKIKSVLNKFNKEIVSGVLGEAYNRLHIISTTLLGVSNSQRELGIAYLKHHSDISKRIIQYALHNLGIDNSSLRHIDFVARVPGRKTIIGSTDENIGKVNLELLSEKIGNDEEVLLFGESMTTNLEDNLRKLRSCLCLPYSMKLQPVNNDGDNWEIVIPKQMVLNEGDEMNLHLLQQIFDNRIANLQQTLDNHLIR